MHKPYLTPREVANLFMISPITVREWVKKGKLKAEITPGGHRRFLPQEVERFALQQGLSIQRFDKAELRILIVDDDEPFCKYLIELIKSQPDTVEIQSTDNGFDAGQLLHTFKPHIVLLDLMLPQIDGFEVCSRLKNDPNTKSIRVIAMTGYNTQENRDRILKAGADHCLAKPFKAAELLNAIGLTSTSV